MCPETWMSECLYSFTATQPVDVIESIEVEDKTVFVIGSYEYIEKENKRIGSINVGLVQSYTDDEEWTTDVKIYQPHYINWGLLDIRLKKVKTDDSNFLVGFGIGSDSSFHAIRIEINDNNEIKINDDILKLSHFDIKSDVIGVGIDAWVSNGDEILDNSSIVSCWSISDGILCYADIPSYSLTNNTASDIQVTSWQAHTSEIWSVAINPYSQGVLLASGADDCILKLWDTRQLEKPIGVNSKIHTMGVTVTAFDPSNENQLFTGSYDEYVRLWDTRNLSKPLNEFRISGGVWRLKFENWGSVDSRLLIAATHGGCHIYSNNTLVKSHTSHRSMAYGIASLKWDLQKIKCSNKRNPTFQIQRRKNTANKKLYISGSFYDKQVAFWEA